MLEPGLHPQIHKVCVTLRRWATRTPTQPSDVHAATTDQDQWLSGASTPSIGACQCARRQDLDCAAAPTSRSGDPGPPWSGPSWWAIPPGKPAAPIIRPGQSEAVTNQSSPRHFARAAAREP